MKVELTFDKLASHYHAEHGQGIMVDGSYNDNVFNFDSFIDCKFECNDLNDMEMKIKKHLEEKNIDIHNSYLDDDCIEFCQIEDIDGNSINDLEKHDPLVQLYSIDYKMFLRVDDAAKDWEFLKKLFPYAIR